MRDHRLSTPRRPASAKGFGGKKYFSTASFRRFPFVWSTRRRARRPRSERRETMQEVDARVGKNWVLGVTALESFMMALDAQVITTAFVTFRSDLGASSVTLQWPASAYNPPVACP